MQCLDYLTSLKSTQQMSDCYVSICNCIHGGLRTTYIHDYKLLSLSIYCISLYDFTNNTYLNPYSTSVY